MKDFLVLGIGNPLLCDDGAGPLISRRAAREFGALADHIDFKEIYSGGYDLIHELSGYQKAVIVDCMVTGRHPAGACRLFPSADFSDTRPLSPLFSHGVTLDRVFSLAAQCGYPMPSEYRILGIEAADCTTFCETVTPAVEQGVRTALGLLRELFTGWTQESILFERPHPLEV